MNFPKVCEQRDDVKPLLQVWIRRAKIRPKEIQLALHPIQNPRVPKRISAFWYVNVHIVKKNMYFKMCLKDVSICSSVYYVKLYIIISIILAILDMYYW